MSEIARLRELLAEATPGRGPTTAFAFVTREDAALLDAARAALPALLDRLEAAEAVVEAAREADRRRQDHGRDAAAETALHDALAATTRCAVGDGTVADIERLTRERDEARADRDRAESSEPGLSEMRAERDLRAERDALAAALAEVRSVVYLALHDSEADRRAERGGR